jgi:hypothetical protein
MKRRGALGERAIYSCRKEMQIFLEMMDKGENLCKGGESWHVLQV